MQTRWQLADWARVGVHLQQAEQYAGDLSRCLKHASATFAFNSSRQTGTRPFTQTTPDVAGAIF